LGPVTEAARLAGLSPMQPSAELQHDLQVLKAAVPDFHNMYIANAAGTTIAFYPPVNEKGEATIGLNFADRPYFQRLKATKQPVLSEVFMGRGGVSSPIVTLSVPVLKGERFQGFALGALDLSRIQDLLRPHGHGGGVMVTLTDAEGRVIASTSPDLAFMQSWNRKKDGISYPIKDAVYRWLPGDEKIPSMTRWKNSFYGQETVIAEDIPWKLSVEVAVAPQQQQLYTIYVRYLAAMAGLTALALLFAVIFSRWIVRPLARLAMVTTDLPTKLLEHQSLTWPESSAAEIDSLMSNTRSMAQALERNFQELQDRSRQLEGANAELQAQVNERTRAQEAQRRFEEKYRTLVEQISAITYIVALEETATVTYVSPQSESILGFSLADFQADPHLWKKQLHPEDRQRALAEVIHSQTTGEPLVTEYRVYNRAGNIVWVRDQGMLVGDSQTRPRLFQGVMFDITEGKLAEEALGQANERLKLLVSESEERNRNISLLNDMTEVFQTCQTSGEAYQAIAYFAPSLFPTEEGALYVLNSSRNLLEAVTVWGDSPPPESLFAPEECWAIRRGRAYALEGAGAGMPCRHVVESLAAGYLCVPMVAQGEALGLLHVRFRPDGREHGPETPLSARMEAKQRLAVTVAENIALALANLYLRETLRGQAIRDPLTGLFNRRYLEETLNRELHRVQRLKGTLGVVMMDLDNFKQFNDTFGHEAGDAILSAVGGLIRTHCREEDIPCRYGGEEFLLVLPGASLEVTVGRAEKLREAVKRLQIQHRGQSLTSTTMSLGVAVFPDHGATGEDLLRAADMALYRTKAEGRDRVVVASDGGVEPVISCKSQRI